MKKLLALSLVAVSLSACGTKTIIKEVAPSTTAEVVEQPQGGESGYFQAIVDNYPNVVNNMGRKWVIDFGYAMCDSITGGMSLSELAEMADKYNLDVALVAFLARQSILNLCPENQWFIDAAGNGSNT